MKRITFHFFAIMLVVLAYIFFPLNPVQLYAWTTPTQADAVQWVKTQANNGTGFNPDGIYGYQCSDFATSYLNWLISGNTALNSPYTTYNAYQYWNLSYPAGWQKITNYDTFVPQPGDLLVFNGTANNPYGHVAVAIEGCTQTVAKVVEQDGSKNWQGAHYNSYGYFTSYISFVGVIRPAFSSPAPQDNAPIGFLDGAVGGDGTVTVSGWARDADSSSTSLTVHVYIGGPAGSSDAEVYAITANISRPDVDKNNNYGFYSTIKTSKRGNQPIYAYAINIGSSAGNTMLTGSPKTVTIAPERIDITSITLDQTNITLNKNSFITLLPIIVPDNATNKSITWTSSDTSIATVDNNGKVNAVNFGTATISATTQNGISASCVVTVPLPFSDVKTDDWFYEDVLYVVHANYFKGIGTTTFSPQSTLTRGQLVAVLGRYAEIDESKYQGASFSDVKNNAYYASAVTWAADNHIVNGVGNQCFMPDQNITRQDLAVILYRFAQYKNKQLTSKRDYAGFADANQIRPYAIDAVKALYCAEIVSGKSHNVFDPTGTATRAECAAMLHRFVQ